MIQFVHFWEINLGSAVVRHRISMWWTVGSGGQMSVSGVKMSSPLEDSLVIHPWVRNWHLGKQTLCWVPSKYHVNKCDVQFPRLIAQKVGIYHSVSQTYGFKVIYKAGVNLSWLIIYKGFMARKVLKCSSELKVDVFQMAKARQRFKQDCQESSFSNLEVESEFK